MSFRISKLLPKFLRGEKDRLKQVENTNDPKNEILLLDNTEITVQLKPSHKGGVLLEKVFEQLNLVEKDFFGLRYIDQFNQTHWLDTNKSISSQIKGCQVNKYYFGVKFYAADPCKLREEITRYQFFLQVKRDILQGRLPLNFDDAVELCGFAVQSELGDYDPKRHTDGYVSEFQLLPNQTQELEERIAAVHRELLGMVPAVAEYRFLEKVKWMDMYGVDLHPVLGEGHTEYFLGLTPMGIIVYKNKSQVASYLWPRITKVTFKAKVFTVRVKDKHNEEHPYSFELATKSACKHLWKCCVEHHAFFRLNQLTESYKSTGKLFSFGSKYRHSNRMDKLLTQSGQYRPPPHVLRVPSRRHTRRSASESRLDARSSNEGIYEASKRPVTMVITPEPVQPPRHSYRNLPSAESPTSTRSAPWASHSERRGLYTSGRESPLSVRSEKMKFPHRRPTSGSESEGGPRRRFYSSRKSSDNESDVSTTRRRRRKDESASESEASYRRNLRQRRAKSAGEDLIGADWRNGAYINRDKENIPNGSLYSIPGEEERKRRRRRTRSKSPNNRPPEELRQHFAYDLIETEGLSEDQLREIPYTQVETKAQPFKVKARHRYKSPKRRSTGDASEVASRQSDGTVTQEEAPPPYHPAKANVPLNNSHNVQYSNSFTKASQEPNRSVPPSVYRHESYSSPNARNRMQYPAVNSSQQHSPYRGGTESRSNLPPNQKYPQSKGPPTQQQQHQRYKPPGYGNSPGYPVHNNNNNIKDTNYQGQNTINRSWNGKEHPYYQSSVDNVECAESDVTSGQQTEPFSENRPEPEPTLNPPQHHRMPSSPRYPVNNGGYYAGGRRPPPQTNDSSSHPPSHQRPVYSWSHFQPVKPSSSPASQSNNSMSTMGSSHSEMTHHVINASGRQEKWTEL